MAPKSEQHKLFWISPLSLLSLCSLLLRLSTSSPMKITTMPTNTQEMVTIIFKPSPLPELFSLTLGAFTKGAMVPVQRSYDSGITENLYHQKKWFRN